jgi:hypothetical protein
MAQSPTIGRIVWYRSRILNYTVPAIVTATVDTLYQPNVEAGYLYPLSSPEHVHINVQTPGRPGRGPDTVDFVDGSGRAVMPNVGGVYQEWDVPFWQPEYPNEPWEDEDQPAGTWTWPRRS